jgi:hypothetical protein
MIGIFEETWPHLITSKQSGERQLDRTQMNSSGELKALELGDERRCTCQGIEAVREGYQEQRREMEGGTGHYL